MSASLEAELWQRTKSLVADAMERPAHERQAFVQQASAGDAALMREVEELLAAAGVATSPLDEPPAELMLEALEQRVSGAWVGRSLGAYRLVSLIARGGMGEVYLGERADGQYEQQVAVKVMRADADLAVALQPFWAERRILASLDHPNLAKLIDAGVTADGAPWFVMELVQGDPIDTYCDDRGLGVDERLRLFVTVCQVVGYAHRRGVVHRDLKPSNIHVRDDGTVKLLDFGIAEQLCPAPAEDPHSGAGYRILTPEYASPEQIRGEPVTPASDVYSLGVVLYRLLARTSPYGHDASAGALNRAICEQDPPWPSRAVDGRLPGARALRRQLSGGLDAVVMKALHKAPAQRYASAAELADDLSRHLQGLAVQAQGHAWRYRSSRFLRRHRVVLGASLLVLVAGSAVATYEAYEAHRQKVRAEQHFADLRKLATIMLRDLQKAIAPLPGGTAARQMIVQNALDSLRRLSVEAKGDAELQIELASGYRSIGDIQGRPYSSNLGDPKSARESYDQGIALVKDLVGNPRVAEPAQSHATAALAQLYQRKGTLLASQDDDAAAEPLVARGVELMDQLAAAGQLDADLQLVHAAMHSQLAQVQRFVDKAAPFFKSLETARRLYLTILTSRPGDEAAASGLATTYLEEGTYYFERDEEAATLQLSIAAFRRALELQGPVVQKHGDDARLRRNFAAHHANLAAALMRAKQPRDAASAYQQAVQILSELSARDPSSAQLRAEVAIVTGSMSRALLANGDAAGAVAAAQRAVEGYNSLPEGSLRDLNTRYKQGVAHYLLGQALAAGHQEQRACAAWRRSLVILKDVQSRNGLGRTDTTPAVVAQSLQRCQPAGSD
ncbi:serine/threonine protein kinase [Pelomonas saccharophila]|uniref:Serine/threonine protein kinase n=1 Tax=Roseateles saccharophilus TaxID=304 RepID=A0ABU1YIR8_ROSSA|nr:serine/threonine-protein kinase [Roseateles saccharophilus]MDR7267941.1 serine/threonine protein kinase [Roseateles saccharophilus]